MSPLQAPSAVAAPAPDRATGSHGTPGPGTARAMAQARLARHLEQRAILEPPALSRAAPLGNPRRQLVAVLQPVGRAAAVETGLTAGVRGLQGVAAAGLLAALEALPDGALDGLHLVTRGAPGRLALCDSAVVTAATLARQGALWAEITRVLAPRGQLALVASHVAAGDEGLALIQALADRLQRPVSAASGAVGCETLAGCWTLDVTRAPAPTRAHSTAAATAPIVGRAALPPLSALVTAGTLASVDDLLYLWGPSGDPSGAALP